MTSFFQYRLSQNLQHAHVKILDDFGEKLKITVDEIYENIIETLKFEKITQYFAPDKFWELVGYNMYHEEAEIYDYIDYINNTLKSPLPVDSYQRSLDQSNFIRSEAFNESLSIISEPFYQSDWTDVKFISLKPTYLTDLSQNSNNNEFESIICISGFLSQRDNLQESWHAVLDRSKNKPVFGYKWPAEDAYTLFPNMLLQIFSIKFNEITHLNIGDIMTFNSVRDIAMDCGKLLAHSIALEYPNYLPKITFVSFSLGTQIVKSCLEELHRLGIKNVVKDVYLLGGASTWNVTDIDIFDTMTGVVTNVYTPEDRILDFYKICTGETPVGQDRLDPKLVFQLHLKGIEVKQVDITKISNGHLKYRSYLDEIFDYIDFNVE